MVTLDEAELRALNQALTTYLPELAYDLARIKSAHARHDLVVYERTLQELHAKVKHALEERGIDTHVS
jgi:hypothetical protein